MSHTLCSNLLGLLLVVDDMAHCVVVRGQSATVAFCDCLELTCVGMCKPFSGGFVHGHQVACMVATFKLVAISKLLAFPINNSVVAVTRQQA